MKISVTFGAWVWKRELFLGGGKGRFKIVELSGTVLSLSLVITVSVF